MVMSKYEESVTKLRACGGQFGVLSPRRERTDRGPPQNHIGDSFRYAERCHLSLAQTVVRSTPEVYLEW